MENSFTIFGIRGSLPAADRKKLVFGQNTSCFYIDTEGESIILDAGSGIIPLGDRLITEKRRKLSILISHIHLDHILGLFFFHPIFSPEFEIHIYSQERELCDIKKQLEQVMKKPIWPVGPESFLAKVKYHTIDPEGIFFTTGGAKVYTTRSNHPDGSTIFRVEKNNKSVVYALDYEHSPESDRKLIEFSHNCDILVYDAFYLPHIYPQKIGWGHSTWEDGIRIANECHAKMTIMAHINPFLPEEELIRADQRIQSINRSCFIGREGEKIIL